MITKTRKLLLLALTLFMFIGGTAVFAEDTAENTDEETEVTTEKQEDTEIEENIPEELEITEPVLEEAPDTEQETLDEATETDDTNDRELRLDREYIEGPEVNPRELIPFSNESTDFAVVQENSNVITPDPSNISVYSYVYDFYVNNILGKPGDTHETGLGWHNNQYGYYWGNDDYYLVNNQIPAYCIEAFNNGPVGTWASRTNIPGTTELQSGYGVNFNSTNFYNNWSGGTVYTGTNQTYFGSYKTLSQSDKDTLALIAYFGRGFYGRNSDDYSGGAQALVWQNSVNSSVARIYYNENHSVKPAADAIMTDVNAFKSGNMTVSLKQDGSAPDEVIAGDIYEITAEFAGLSHFEIGDATFTIEGGTIVDASGNPDEDGHYVIFDGGEYALTATYNYENEGPISTDPYVLWHNGPYQRVMVRHIPTYKKYITVRGEAEESSGILTLKKVAASKNGVSVIVDDVNYSLEGAKFNLYDEHDNFITELITNSNGEAVYEGLSVGKYYVKETTPSKGFEVNPDKIEFEVTRKAGAASNNVPDTLSVESTTSHGTEVIHTFGYSGYPAVAGNGIDWASTQRLWSSTVNDFLFCVDPEGHIDAIINNPATFTKTDTPRNLGLNQPLSEEQQARITEIVGMGKVNGVPDDCIQAAIWNYWYMSRGWMGAIDTNAQGLAAWTDVHPEWCNPNHSVYTNVDGLTFIGGFYYRSNVQSAFFYVGIDEGAASVDITVDETPILGKLSVQKVFKGQGLPGATMQVLDGTTVIDEWVSDGSVHTIDNLPLGKTYTVHEVSAPEGYVSGLVDQSVTITGENTVTVENYQFIVNKVDSEGNTVSGARMEAYVGGRKVDEWTSGTTGHIINGLTVGDNVQIVEVAAPQGYVKASNVTKTVEAKNDSVDIVDDQVLLNKVDGSGRLLSGVTFEITDRDTGEKVSEVTTASNLLPLNNLEYGKTYVIRETVTPDGYVKAKDVTFTVDGSKTITITNIRVAHEKYGPEDTILTGAKFECRDTLTGEVVDSWTSGNDKYYISNLIEGRSYKIVEIEAPDGYVKAKDVPFTIGSINDINQ